MGGRRGRDLGKSRKGRKDRDGMGDGDGGRLWMEGRLGRKEGLRIEGVAGKEGKDRNGTGSVEQRRGMDGSGIGE